MFDLKNLIKKFALSGIVACGIGAASAQEHSILLYGNVAGSYASSETGAASVSNSTFGINLGAGYQISKHVTLGLIARYRRSEHERTWPGQAEETHANQWAIGPFARYNWYFGERFFAYLQGDVLYTRNSGHVRGLNVNLFPAVGVFVHKHWAINLNIGGIDYRHAKSGPANNNNLSYSFGQGLAIGVSKNFVRKPCAAPTTP